MNEHSKNTSIFDLSSIDWDDIDDSRHMGDDGPRSKTPLESVERARQKQADNAELALVPTGTPLDSGATITLLRHGSHIGKKFFIDSAGEIGRLTQANFWQGTAEVLPAPTAEALVEIITNLDPESDVLALGRIRDGRASAPVAVADKAGGDVIARTREHLGHPIGVPGWLLLDLDLKDLPLHVRDRIKALGGIEGALEALIPGFAGSTRVMKPSSSGGVHKAVGEAGDITGWHVLVQIADASENEEFLVRLKLREWQLGLAYYMISADGSRLERGFTDSSVGGPERLIFTAEPLLGPGLERTAPRIVARDGKLLQLPEVDDWDAAGLLRAEAFAEKAAEAAQVRRVWQEARIAGLMEERGVTRPTATMIVKRLTDVAEIDDNFMLSSGNGRKIRAGDLLDRLEAEQASGKHGVMGRLNDPTKERGEDALIMWGGSDPYPTLQSYANGGNGAGGPRVYGFSRYKLGVEGADIDEIADLAELYHAERERQLAAVPGAMQDYIAKVLQIASEPHKIHRAVVDEAGVARAELEAETGTPWEEIDESKRRSETRKAQRRVKKARGLDGMPHLRFREPNRYDEKGVLLIDNGYTGKEQWGLQPKHLIGFDAPDVVVDRKSLIVGTQGIGKTWATLGSLRFTAPATTLMCAPDGDMADQHMREFEEKLAELDDPGIAPLYFRRRGRGAQRPDDRSRSMCEIPEIAAAVGEAGVNVIGALCAHCPLANECAYMAQEREIEATIEAGRGVIIFGVHEHAYLALPGGHLADILIIDERPRDFGTIVIDLPISALDGLPRVKPREQKEDESDERYAKYLARRKERRGGVDALLRKVKEALTSDVVPPLDQLEALGITPEGLRKAAKYIKSTGDKKTENLIANAVEKAAEARRDDDWAGDLLDKVAGRLKDAKKRYTDELVELLTLLATQLENHRAALASYVDAASRADEREAEVARLKAKQIERAFAGDMDGAKAAGLAAYEMEQEQQKASRPAGVPVGVLVRLQDGALPDIGSETVTIHTMKRVAHDAPTLYLDGTGSERVADRLIHGIKEHRFIVDRDADVTVITERRFPKSALVGMWTDGSGKVRGGRKKERLAAKLRQDISRGIMKHASALGAKEAFVGTLMAAEDSFAELLSVSQDTEFLTGHFNALRGKNRFKESKAGYLIGTLHVPLEAAVSIALCLASGVATSFEHASTPMSKETVSRIAHDGTTVDLKRTAHPNEWVQLVIEQTTIAEFEQALDRVRVVHQFRHIVIMADEVPKTVPISRSMPFDDFVDASTPLTRAIQTHGFFITEKREAVRAMPDVFTVNSAQAAIEGFKEAHDRREKSGWLQAYSNRYLQPSTFSESIEGFPRGDDDISLQVESTLSESSPADAFVEVSYRAAIHGENGKVRRQTFSAIAPAVWGADRIEASIVSLYERLGREVSDIAVSGLYGPKDCDTVFIPAHGEMLSSDEQREIVLKSGLTPHQSYPTVPFPGAIRGVRVKKEILSPELRDKPLFLTIPQELRDSLVVMPLEDEEEPRIRYYLVELAFDDWERDKHRIKKRRNAWSRVLVLVPAMSTVEATASAAWPDMTDVPVLVNLTKQGKDEHGNPWPERCALRPAPERMDPIELEKPNRTTKKVLFFYDSLADAREKMARLAQCFDTTVDQTRPAPIANEFLDDKLISVEYEVESSEESGPKFDFTQEQPEGDVWEGDPTIALYDLYAEKHGLPKSSELGRDAEAYIRKRGQIFSDHDFRQWMLETPGWQP